MKKRLEEIFDSLSDKELDALLGDGVNVNIPAESSADVIKRLTSERVAMSVKSRQRKRRNRSILMIAASFALLLIASLGLYACAEEVREYNSAVEFFNNSSLSTEGLSRSEIKSVWHDIAEGRFSDPKTAELLIDAIKESGIAAGESIDADATPNAVRELYWKWCDFLTNGYESDSGDVVEFSVVYNYIDSSIDFEHHFLVKYVNGTEIWRSLIEGFDGLPDSMLIGEYVFVYRLYDMICFSADSGEKLWSHGFVRENIKALLNNGDGTFSVFATGYDTEHVSKKRVRKPWVTVTKFDFNGDVLSKTQTYTEEYGTIDVIEKYGDGYILNAYGNGETTQKFIALDADGNFITTVDYSVNQNDEIHISDIIEYSGKIYVSAYYYPEQAEIIWSQWKKENMYVTNTGETPELLDIVKARHVAILMTVDFDKGICETVHSLSGALGADLALGENRKLIWDAELICAAFYMPFYSGRPPLNIYANIFRYRFNSKGTLIDVYDTGYYSSFDDHNP